MDICTNYNIINIHKVKGSYCFILRFNIFIFYMCTHSWSASKWTTICCVGCSCYVSRWLSYRLVYKCSSFNNSSLPDGALRLASRSTTTSDSITIIITHTTSIDTNIATTMISVLPLLVSIIARVLLIIHTSVLIQFPQAPFISWCVQPNPGLTVLL